MHTILRYYYTNINRRREQQQQQKRKQNKKKLGEKLVKKKGLDWKVRPFPDVLWCEVEEATPLFMYLTYMYILMDARGTLVCLSLFCGCVCVCVLRPASARAVRELHRSHYPHTHRRRKPRPSWSAIGCVSAIRSDGRLSKFLFYLSIFPFIYFCFFFLFCF